jgi:HAD superfamily hydrolase (TIGR01458 family)
MNSQKRIPLLIDFDGVLKIGNEPAEFLAEFLAYIQKKNIPSFILSNSTLRTGKDITEFLKRKGFNCDIPALTTIDASYFFLKNNFKTAAVFCDPSVKSVFDEFITDDFPEAVLVGDLGNQWTYETLNQIFRLVHSGSKLIAMQMNKYWNPDGKEICLDAGAFISAIEYAAGIKAALIGKPSPIYFKTAIQQLGLPENTDFLMLGDDPETDIIAAQQCGGKGILIYSGKTKYPFESRTIKPDFEVMNLKETTLLLDKILS